MKRMVTIKWDKRLREKYGYSSAKDINVRDKDCFKASCFRAHDWNHDGHLYCWTREQGSCPDTKKMTYSNRPKRAGYLKMDESRIIYLKHKEEGWVCESATENIECICGHDKQLHFKGVTRCRASDAGQVYSGIMASKKCGCQRYEPKFVEISKEEYVKELKRGANADSSQP